MRAISSLIARSSTSLFAAAGSFLSKVVVVDDVVVDVADVFDVDVEEAADVDVAPDGDVGVDVGVDVEVADVGDFPAGWAAATIVSAKVAGVQTSKLNVYARKRILFLLPAVNFNTSFIVLLLAQIFEARCSLTLVRAILVACSVLCIREQFQACVRANLELMLKLEPNPIRHHKHH